MIHIIRWLDIILLSQYVLYCWLYKQVKGKVLKKTDTDTDTALFLDWPASVFNIIICLSFCEYAELSWKPDEDFAQHHAALHALHQTQPRLQTAHLQKGRGMKNRCISICSLGIPLRVADL